MNGGAGPGPTVLITGGNGGIGRALGRSLDAHHDVVAADLSCEGCPVDCRQLDLGDAGSVAALRDAIDARTGGRLASVVHLAAYFDFTGRPDPRYDAVNVAGTRRLLEALASLEVEQFIYASTVLVHRPTRPGVPIDETSPLEPRWVYPQSKLAAEGVVRAAHGRIPFVILRIAGLYRDTGAVPTLAHQLARIYERRLDSHLFPGDPRHAQAYLHIDDLVGAIGRVVARRGRLPPEATLLLGEPDAVSYADIQHAAGCALHGEAWATAHVPPAVARAGARARLGLQRLVPDTLAAGREPFIRPFMVALADDHYELDISRARNWLGWTPRHRLLATLPRIVAALRADPERWYRDTGLPAPPGLPGARAGDAGH